MELSEFIIKLRSLGYEVDFGARESGEKSENPESRNKTIYFCKIDHPSIEIKQEHYDETIEGVIDWAIEGLKADIKKTSDILEKTKKLLD